MERALRNKKAIGFFILPALLWYLFIVMVPIVQSGGYSLLDWNGINQGTFTGLSNYTKLFQDSIFWLSFRNSSWLALASIFIQMPISMLLAMLLANGVRGENFYRNAFFVPVIISSTVIANIWMKVYHPSYGILNTILSNIGLESWTREWLGSRDTALLSCFVPMIWQYIGYNMLLFYSSAKSLSDDIIEAAKIDGASKREISIQIIIPMILPMIKAVTIFCIVGSLKSFDMIFILTGGGPARASIVLTLMMYTEIFTKNNYGYASAIAIIIVVICLISTLLVEAVFRFLKR